MSRYFQRTTQTGWRRQRTLQSAADLSLGSGYDYADQEISAERTQPLRPLNLVSDFTTPLFQSVGVCLWSFIVLIVGWLLFDWLTWRVVIFTSVLCGGVWFIGSLWINRRLLYRVEKIVSFDLDNDGEIGEPRALEPVEVVNRSQQSIHRLDLPTISDDTLKDFARGVASGKSLSQSTWIGNGGLFSREEYDHLMAEMTRANLVQWRNPDAPAQGRVLTDLGQQTIEMWSK